MIILVILVLIIVAFLYYLPEGREPATVQSQAEIIERLKPSVVSVWSGKEGRQLNQGSGFVVGEGGLILTNLHVLGDGDSITVKFDIDVSTGSYDAGIVASNAEYDLLLLSIDAPGLSPLPQAGRRVLQGDKVWAIGFPSSQGLDAQRITVTSGIVSRVNPGSNGVPVIVQTDAYMTYGSSGGPLYDLDAGGVVGICSWSQHDRQDKPLTGINYALSIEKVMELFGEYIER